MPAVLLPTHAESVVASVLVQKYNSANRISCPSASFMLGYAAFSK